MVPGQASAMFWMNLINQTDDRHWRSKITRRVDTRSGRMCQAIKVSIC
jgi:hypothetical protein